ncbi:hypothetical protein ACQP3D_31160, partial [Escherichia coli]
READVSLHREAREARSEKQRTEDAVNQEPEKRWKLEFRMETSKKLIKKIPCVVYFIKSVRCPT